MKHFDELKGILLDNNIPVDFLQEAIKQGMEKKKPYLDLLKLNEANNWRVVIDLPQDMDSLPFVRNFLSIMSGFSLEHTNILDYQYIKVGKNKFKVTKYISQYWEKIQKTDAYYRLIRAIHNDLLDNGQNGLLKDIDKYLDIPLQKFLIAYGDYIKNGLVVVLSANPYDYLILYDEEEHLCKFSSCVRFNNGGGEYFNSTLVYLDSSSVFVAYTANKDNLDVKIGRSMVYIGGYTTVSTSRRYGNISEVALLAIRDYCQQALNGYQLNLAGIEPEIYTVSGKIIESVVRNANASYNASYIDYNYGVVTIRKGKELEQCLLGEGICLECGGTLENSCIGGTCPDCRDENHVRCIHCDEFISRDDAFYYSDEPYCEHCYNDMFSQCYRCDEAVPSESTYEVYHGERSHCVCSDCLEQYYTECIKCNTFCESDEMTTNADGNYICQYCVSEYYGECMDCGELFLRKDITEIDNEWYCEGCRDDKYILNTKGEWIEKELEPEREANNG